MHLPALLLCAIASTTVYAINRSSSRTTLRPRQNTEYLIGGSRTPFIAGENSPNNDEGAPLDGTEASVILPDDWPATVYSYVWLLDNEVLRQTILGPAYAANEAGKLSNLDSTSVQCLCSGGSACSCMENDDVGYLNMLLERAIAENEDEDADGNAEVHIPGLHDNLDHGFTIAIRGDVAESGVGFSDSAATVKRNVDDIQDNGNVDGAEAAPAAGDDVQDNGGGDGAETEPAPVPGDDVEDNGDVDGAEPAPVPGDNVEDDGDGDGDLFGIGGIVGNVADSIGGIVDSVTNGVDTVSDTLESLTGAASRPQASGYGMCAAAVTALVLGFAAL